MLIATPRTDFNQFGQQQLIDMLAASDVASVRNTADIWDQVGALLHELADAIARETGQFGQMWAGNAASSYEQMMGDLVTAERKLAAHCWAVRDLIHDAADALELAKTQMPAAVAVPELSPSTVALATTPLQMMDVSSPEAMLALQQRQNTAIAAVQSQQQAVAQASAAQTQAAQVMTTLADNYSTDTTSIPEAPMASAPTTSNGANGIVATPFSGAINASGTGTADELSDPYSSGLLNGLTGIGTSADGTGISSSPLFGDLVTAGIAAAAAASTGRFGLGMPQVPGFARPGSGDGRATHPGGQTPTPDTKLPDTSGLAGGGGGGLGGISAGGGVGGLAGAAPAAAGFGQLATGAPMPTAASALGTAGGAVGAAPAAGASGMPMGAMPYGGMGGMGGDGGNRRVPQWLVETEDVWGESSAVAPTSIGEV